jgi:hypothetical protein
VTDKICDSCWSRLEAFHDFHTLISLQYGMIEVVEVKTDKTMALYEDDLIEDVDEDEDEAYEEVQVEALDECTFEEINEEVEMSSSSFRSHGKRSSAPPIDPEGKFNDNHMITTWYYPSNATSR